MRRGVVVGSGSLAAAVAACAERRGVSVRRLHRPTDRELTGAISGDLAFVVVASHDDVEALRWALVSEHAHPGVRMLVTIFDKTIARQVERTIPNCVVLSLADAAAPVLVEACLRAESRERPRPARLRDAVLSQLRPFDASSRMLILGLAGLAAVIVADAVLGFATLGETGAGAIFDAVQTATTVGPHQHMAHSPDWYRLVAAGLMLLATAFVALTTAGLVNRTLSRRLVTIVGKRVLPRRRHVVVVGGGQVGFRLSVELRRLGVGVVLVERDRDAPFVHLAKRAGLPVVVGDGRERGLLERLRTGRAAAIAAVTSDDLENIAVSMAALAVSPSAHVVLRAGDGDVVSETRALFSIGTVSDVTRVAAERIVGTLLPAPDGADA
jgi:hypothetical protein